VALNAWSGRFAAENAVVVLESVRQADGYSCQAAGISSLSLLARRVDVPRSFKIGDLSSVGAQKRGPNRRFAVTTRNVEHIIRLT
jgi:hypothetical protein